MLSDQPITNASPTLGIDSKSGKISQNASPFASLKSSQRNKDYNQSLALAFHPSMPLTLEQKHSWEWLICSAIVCCIYAAAYTFAGIELPLPSWDTSEERFIVIGWLLHLAGIICFVFSTLIVFLRRSPFHTASLIIYFFSLSFFICGSILHTSRLESSDAIIPFGSQQATAVQLQWLGTLVFYIMFSFAVWRTPGVHARLTNKEDLQKHQLLMSIREIELRNQELRKQIEEVENQQRQEKASADAVTAVNLPLQSTPSRPTSSRSAKVVPLTSSPSVPDQPNFHSAVEAAETSKFDNELSSNRQRFETPVKA